MKFERFIASRYLISKHKLNYITVISIISIFGITVGVAALIVVLSIFNGFGSIVTQILINFDPHIKIESLLPEGVSNYSEIQNELEKNPLIESYSPFVSGKVVIFSSRIIRVVTLNGISSNVSKEFNGLRKNIVLGRYNLQKVGDLPSIMIGLGLASRMQTIIGDTVAIVSPVGFENVITSYAPPKTERFIIAGIFDSHNKDVDAFNVYTSLTVAQNLLGYVNRINGFEMRLKNISNADKLKIYLQGKVNPNQFEVKTWYDLHKQLYNVMLIERWTAYIILSLIIAVATFSIFGSLTMSVIEKKRDIGVLKSMGASDKSILKIFLFEGILVGIVGTILGTILGLFICYLQITYKIYPLDSTVYIIDALPVEIRLADILAIGFAAMLLSTIAGLYPARKAASTLPLEAIKWE